MGIVVLGASGRLGRLIRATWPQSDTVWQSRRAGNGLTAQAIDDPEGLAHLLKDADAVLCLLGVPPGNPADMQDNVSLAKSALDAASTVQCGRVLLASSAAVYGAAPGPLREDLDVTPMSPYGQAKLAMEEMAASHPHPSTCLRIGNVAGADAILGGWRPGFELDQLPDGTTPRRSYIGPYTLAQTLGQLYRTPGLPDLLNIAAPGTIAMGDLLDAAGCNWTARPAPADTFPEVILDLSRLASLFALSPATPASLVDEWQTIRSAL